MNIFKILFACLFLSHTNAFSESVLPPIDLKTNTIEIKNDTPMRIGVIIAPPYVKVQDDQYAGIAVDIWNYIASTYHWRYTFVPVSENTEDDLDKIKELNLDAIIGPITVTPDRLNKAEFSIPYFLTSINVLTQKQDITAFETILSFFSHKTMVTISILLLSFLLYINLLWYMERGKSEELSIDYLDALKYGFWAHLLKKGLSMPTTTAGRLVAMTWLFSQSILIGSIYANYTATLTVNLHNEQYRVNFAEDLTGIVIAGEKGRHPTERAEQLGISVKKTNTLAEAIEQLKTSQVEGVVVDPVLGNEYLLEHHLSSQFVINPYVMQYVQLAFVTPLNSPLRHKIDWAIAYLQDNKLIIPICARYIGHLSKVHCNL
jgi:polar amino acid transport system substrate-binding protein